MAFQLIVSKNFATFATGTASLVSNGFTPLRASIYAVTSVPADFQNDCVGTPTQVAAFRSNFLLRAESHQNTRVVFETGVLASGLPSALMNQGFYAVLRFNPPGTAQATDCYLLGLETTGFLRIYSYTGGSFTSPSTVVAGTLTLLNSYGFAVYQGHNYIITAQCTGIGPTALEVSCYDVATPGTVINITASDNSSPLQSGPGTYGLNIDNVGDGALAGNTLNFKTFASYFDGGFSATEVTVAPNQTALTIHLVNSEATWTPGTPGAPTFTVTGHAAKTAQVVDTTSTAHLTVNTTTPGTITISDGTYSTTVAVVQTVAFTDPNVSTAPYAAKLASLSTNCTGPFFKVAWTGTLFILNTDNTHLNAAYGAYPNTFWPNLRYSLDGGEWTDISLHDATSTTGAGTLAIVSGLAAGTHTLEFEVPAFYENGNFFDIWNTPNVQIVATGFTIDGSTVALPTSPTSKHSLYVRPKNLLVYSDSIGEGVNVYGAAGGVQYSDATVAWPSILKEYLKAEMGNISFQGQGWVQTGLGNVLALPDTWDEYYSGASRLVNGLLDPPPDYIACMMGQNDASNGKTNTAVIDAVQSVLPLWRTAAPDALILIIIPLSGAMRDALSLAVSQYIAATGDTRCILIDLGMLSATSMELGLYWVTEVGRVLGASEQSVDGIHPLPVIHGQAAARIAAAIEPYANSPPGGVGFQWSSMAVITLPGQAPWLYISRADLPQIVVLSTNPPPGTTIKGIVYELVIGDRAIYKRLLRVKLFGTGTVTGGTVTVTPDGVTGKSAVAPAAELVASLPPQNAYKGMLLEWNIPANMDGFLFKVTFALEGADIEITDMVPLWAVQDATP